MDSEATSAEVVVAALGVAIGIPVTGEATARLRRQWSRSLTDRSPTTFVDLDPLAIEDDVARDYAITTLVTRMALHHTAGQRLNLHAGAVADVQGRVLAVIGPSGSGKTTSIALLATRLGYLSDETLSLGDALAVHGHPKPLSVIGDPELPRLKASVSPDDLGLLRPPAACRLHRVVLLHRGAEGSGLAPLTPAYAIAEMVEQTSSLVALEHPILRLAETIDACGGAWSLRYSEIGEHVDELVALLDRAPRPAPARTHHPGGTDPEPVAGAWCRTPWLDAVEYDDELVVMIDDQVRVLAGLGLVLWLALDVARGLDELVGRTVELWGEHPDAGALVEDALGVLAEQGLVTPPTEA